MIFGPVVFVPGAMSCTRHTHHRSKNHAAKHRLHTHKYHKSFQSSTFNTP